MPEFTDPDEHETCARALFDAWLDDRVEPATPEHRLLQALWRTADPAERRLLLRTFLRARGRDPEP
jgi:hypothetical protein